MCGGRGGGGGNWRERGWGGVIRGNERWGGGGRALGKGNIINSCVTSDRYRAITKHSLADCFCSKFPDFGCVCLCLCVCVCF